MSVTKDWKITVEQYPAFKNFNPYEECSGFVPACNYLLKHKNMNHIPAFTLYDAFGLEKKTIEKLAKAMGKYYFSYFNFCKIDYIPSIR